MRPAQLLAAAGLAAALTGGACGSQQATAPRAAAPAASATPAPATPSPAATATPTAAPAPAGPPPAAPADCASASRPPVPAPTPDSRFPDAPVPGVFIVGTVCSAATGRPLPGATITSVLQVQLCAEGHQPWRCGASVTTDGQGHYGFAFYDPGDYAVTVGGPGYASRRGTVHVARPGVVTGDWRLAPAA